MLWSDQWSPSCSGDVYRNRHPHTTCSNTRALTTACCCIDTLLPCYHVVLNGRKFQVQLDKKGGSTFQADPTPPPYLPQLDGLPVPQVGRGVTAPSPPQLEAGTSGVDTIKSVVFTTQQSKVWGRGIPSRAYWSQSSPGWQGGRCP